MMMRMKDRRRGGRGVTSAMTPGVGSQLADTIPHTGSVSRQESRRRGSHRGVGVSVASRGYDETPNRSSSAQERIKIKPVSGWSELAQEQRARVWQARDTGTSKPSRNPRPVPRQSLRNNRETR